MNINYYFNYSELIQKYTEKKIKSSSGQEIDLLKEIITDINEIKKTVKRIEEIKKELKK